MDTSIVIHMCTQKKALTLQSSQFTTSKLPSPVLFFKSKSVIHVQGSNSIIVAAVNKVKITFHCSNPFISFYTKVPLSLRLWTVFTIQHLEHIQVWPPYTYQYITISLLISLYINNSIFTTFPQVYATILKINKHPCCKVMDCSFTSDHSIHSHFCPLLNNLICPYTVQI